MRHQQRASAAVAAAAVAQGSDSSPAGRDGTKAGRNPPSSATPGPNASAMAVKGVPAGGKRASGQHPYAAGQGADYGGGGFRSGQATPAQGMSTSGVQNQSGQGIGNGEYREDKGGFSLLKLLTCRCG